jgi:hypothetical protein
MTVDLNSKGRLAIIGAFLLMLMLPLLQMTFVIVKVPLLDENRTRAPAPQWNDLAHPSNFTTKAQQWFRDHYGFRDILIRLQTQIEYSVFGFSDRIHIGRDGWLFYRSVIDREEPAVEAMTDAQLDHTVASFARLRDWLAARDIRLVVITNQMKDRFYPEFLPYTAKQARSRHRFDDFRARMRGLPGITYIDTTPPLLKLKQQRLIFHKTDFHWNDPAAFVIAGELVDTIAALDHRPLPFWHNVLDLQQLNFSGGQARFMPLFKSPHEQGLFVRPNWPDAHLTTVTNMKPFEWITHAPGDNLLPPTVVFADSFFDGMMRSGLANYFQSLALARRNQAQMDAALRAIPSGTKFFILQFIEVALPQFRTLSIPDGK